MTASMIHFELRSLLRDRAFLLLAVILLAAIAMAASNGMRWLHFQQRAIAHIRADEAEKLLTARTAAAAILSGQQTAPRGWWNNPADTRGFAYGFISSHAIKPPSVLAPLTVGQTDLLPYYFKVNAGRRGNLLASYELENPRRLLLGRFDLTFVILFVLPVALLVAGHGALAAEREDGRLSILMAHGISPRRLALTRLAVRCGILLASAIAAVLAALALTGFDYSADGAGAALSRWLIVAIAYGAFWTAATLLVVAFARSTSTAALSLAASWLVLVIIAPWALNLAANRLHPLPSRTAYVLAQRAASDAAEAQGSALLGRYLQDHPEFAPANTPLDAMHYSAIDIATTQHVEAQLQPIEAAFDGRLAEQQRLIDRWQWLSPAVLAQQAFNELAGAGWSRHRAFVVQTNSHSDALRRYFNPRILRGEFTFTSFDEWPRYAWREPAGYDQRHRMRWALLGLLIPAGTLLFIAIWALSGRRATLRALAA